jgi:hypothetical protein
MVSKFQYSALSKSWFGGRVESNRGRWNWMALLEVTPAPSLSHMTVFCRNVSHLAFKENGLFVAIVNQR